STFYTLHSKFSNIPIVILTGLNNPELENRLILDGADDYLIKTPLLTAQHILHRLNFAIGRYTQKKIIKELELTKDQLTNDLSNLNETVKESSNRTLLILIVSVVVITILSGLMILSLSIINPDNNNTTLI